MATTSIAQTPRSRTPIAPERVFQTYTHECATHGEWGAYRRTGDRYGRSDEWARKACAKYRAQTVQATTAVQLAPELAYVPPPDGYPAPVPLPTIPTDAIKLPTTPAKAPTTKLDVIGEVGSVAETFSGSQLANTVNSQPGERETPEPAPWVDPLPPTIPGSPPDEPDLWPFPAPVPEPLPEPEPVPTARQVVIRERVVMRAPVEQHRPSALQWMADHPVARQQLLAWAVFLVLVLLTMVGA